MGILRLFCLLVGGLRRVDSAVILRLFFKTTVRLLEQLICTPRPFCCPLSSPPPQQFSHNHPSILSAIIPGALEVLEQCSVLGHLSDVLPVLLLREAHDAEDAVQLVVVVRVRRLDVLLPTVEDGLRRQQLGENTADRPDICRTTEIRDLAQIRISADSTSEPVCPEFVLLDETHFVRIY